MFADPRDISAEEKFTRSLKGFQWIRTNHGSLFDRASADSYYNRFPEPHYGGVGGDSGERVAVIDPAQVAEYMAGYDWNEQYGEKKSWD